MSQCQFDPFDRSTYSGPSKYAPASRVDWDMQEPPPDAPPEDVHAEQLRMAQAHGELQATMCYAFYLTLRTHLQQGDPVLRPERHYDDIALYLTAQVWRPQ